MTDHSRVVSAPKGDPPSLRSQRGLVCPRCRAARENEKVPHAIVRCADDGYVFVRAEALADADGDPFLGRTIAGRYVVLGKLGAGSMGTVYRARHETLGRDVAVKILREGRVSLANAKERFEREARALSMLASPHTVTVYDFGEIPIDPDGDELATGISLYLAMELLEGESLGERLERTPHLPVAEAAKIARHALLSLTEAHEKGIIHRDLKPDNLFLTRAPTGEMHCKLLDFSIAKVMNDPAPRGSVLETQEGTVFGTPRYMSPEQAQGRALDARSDLYSLGVLLYQMLTGKPPFTDEDAVVVMAHHIRSKPAPPIEVAPDAGIPSALSDLILRALEKDPSKRPANARAFIEALDQAIEVRKDRETGGDAKPERAVEPSDNIKNAKQEIKTAQKAERRSPPSTPPPSDEPTREGPNSLSSPPPRSVPLSPPRAPGLVHAFVGVSAVAAGVLGGVLAFSLAYAPRPEQVVAEDTGLREVAARMSAAVDELRQSEDAARREATASPDDEKEGTLVEGEAKGADGDADGAEKPPAFKESAAPAPSPTRAFEVPPPPPQWPRRRFNK